MSKKIIIAIAAGVVSLALSFGLSVTLNKPEAQPAEAVETTGQKVETDAKADEDILAARAATKISMNEKKLKSLIIDVREKMNEYNEKMSELEKREERIKSAHQSLKKDLEKLENLRIELASAVAEIKTEREKLDKTRLEINDTEKSNLVSLAATYDKMDALAAGQILANMSKSQDQILINNADEAVKILRYMTERTRAKVLAELVGIEPQLASLFSQRLKEVVEKD